MDFVSKFFVDHSEYQHDQITNMKLIHSGFSNQNYLLTLKNGLQFQVRFSKKINLYRQNEWKALQLLPERNFIYFDPQTGNAIKKWIPGKEIKNWTNKLIINLAQKLSLLHQIKPVGLIPHDYYEYLKNDLDFCYQKRYLTLIKKYENDVRVFSHNDLNKHNLIYQNEEVFLIDFEYARSNSKYFDLANLINHADFTAEQLTIFLQHYGKVNQEKLNDYLFINLFFAYCWSLAHPDSKLIKPYQKEFYEKLLKVNC